MTRRVLMTALFLVLVTASGASAAAFERIGPAGGLVDLDAAGDRVVATDLGGRTAVRTAQGWRYCATHRLPVREPPAVSVAADGQLWATLDGRVFRAGPDCERWRRVAIPGETLAVVAAGTALVALQDGAAVRRSVDGGATWQQVRTPSIRALEVVAGGTTVLLFGRSGSACSPDGGRSWRTFAEPGFLDGIAIGRDGAIWMSSEDGELWRSMGCAAAVTLTESAAGKVIGVDAAGLPVQERELRLARTGLDGVPIGWGPVLPFAPVDAVPLPDGRLVVSTLNGPVAVDGAVVESDARGLLAYVTTPAVLDGGRRLVAGGVFGADDVASDDFGATWHTVVSDPGYAADLAVRLDDQAVAMIQLPGDNGGDPRGLLSMDGGASWRPSYHAPWISGDVIDDPDSTAVWALRSGQIWRSADSGLHWRRLRIRVRSNGTAMARDGQLLVVGRRRDGTARLVSVAPDGRVRRALTEGLPARCGASSGALVAVGRRALLALACAAPYRSATGRRFRRDDVGLPRPSTSVLSFAPHLVVDPATRRTYLGRVDGLFVQERPGARWRRVPGAPRAVQGLERAEDWLLVESERGLERMALR